jgi:RNA polymerase sigma factor (sigma-70 family)
VVVIESSFLSCSKIFGYETLGYKNLKYDAGLPIALDGGAIGVAALTNEDKILELRQYLINGLVREGWNSADAEDWAHDILELAIRYKDQLRNPESFMGWLKMIKVNLLRNRYKRRKKEEAAFEKAFEINMISAQTNFHPENDYDGRLGIPQSKFHCAQSSDGLENLSTVLFNELPGLFDGMGERMRKIFISRVILEFSTRETMKLMNLSENVVKKDLMKAMDKVKQAGREYVEGTLKGVL